jgi:hypothetical protein
MQTRFLTTLLALTIFAIPAVAPASQPAAVRLIDLTPAVTVTPVTHELASLLLDPATDTVALSIELVDGYTTLEWINQDPFAL